MNQQIKFRKTERGVALVITLIMLAVVTVMAIIFLGVTRRERGSIKLTEDQAMARAMAEAALERAKIQAVAGMASSGSKTFYDLFNSKNYINPNGFDPAKGADPFNVGWTYANGNPVTGNDRLTMLGNLRYDPRAPVFIPTNNVGEMDFRFSVDFNRNREFEPTGFLGETNSLGDPVTFRTSGGQIVTVTNRFIGDPQWIGVLEHPDRPHGENNKFVGRYAFIATPVGKTLDLNYIHNQSQTNSDNDISQLQNNNGFLRNQGFGSWEMNLAAFLRELNTNNYAWPSNTYRDRGVGGGFSAGDAFNNARGILNIRYNGRRSNLLAGNATTNEFQVDGFDSYGDDPIPVGMVSTNREVLFSTQFDTDSNLRPWPGSSNIFELTDPQQLFGLGSHSAMMSDFTNRLQQPGRSIHKASYDRYTFYRMLSQMGAESKGNLAGKLHLNYENTPGIVTNLTKPWPNAMAFFTNAADLMLKASMERRIYPLKVSANRTNLFTNYFIGQTLVRPDLSVTNIQLWHEPLVGSLNTSNEYTGEIHRILQLAVNIYDAMTNRVLSGGNARYPFLPTVIKPVFTKTLTNIVISGFTEVTNSRVPSDSLWTDLYDFATNNSVTANVYTNVIIYGQPFLVGAKKGHPNFNELSMESFVSMSRRLQFTKDATDKVTITNQMLTFSLSSILGLEAWNSYKPDYDKEVRVYSDIHSWISVSNVTSFATNRVAFKTMTNVVVNVTGNNFWVDITAWPGTTNYARLPENARILLSNNIVLLNDANYSNLRPPLLSLSTNVAFEPLNYDQPHFRLYTTNRVRYWVVDKATDRLIDFVTFDRLTTYMDIGNLMNEGTQPATALVSNQGSVNEAAFWQTNRFSVGPGGLTTGMSNQIAASLGLLTFPTNSPPELQYDNFWREYNRRLGDRRQSIDTFRRFMGLDPLYDRQVVTTTPDGTTYEAPFTPIRRYYQKWNWEVNDPFVHYNEADLAVKPEITPIRPPNQDARLISQSVSSLGKFNDAYQPWGGGADRDPAYLTNAYRTTIKDPGISTSDDWIFPVDLIADQNYIRFPSIGWLGRVHRGTPWQTVYLKSAAEHPIGWAKVNTRMGTHPTNDWRLLEVFTTAPNENATRGLLSVNQTNTAAWSAVLSGVPIIRFNDRVRDPEDVTYRQELIQPGDGSVSNIVASINAYRASLTKTTYLALPTGVVLASITPAHGFQHLGEVLGARGLSDASPYLLNTANGPLTTNHVNFGLRDEMHERIPQSILSLLTKDEPRFVVYSFGQSLKPAQGSMSTSGNFYGMITNYQVTGEVITKTTFRVDGELDDPSKPLRTVVESYKVLPPPE